jgi:hypothetical protein
MIRSFKISFQLLGFFIGLFCVTSCDREKLADIEPIKIQRFDLDLLKFDTAQFEASEKKMLGQYGDVYTFFVEKLMGLGSLDTKNSYYYRPHMNRFLGEEYPSIMDTLKRYILNDVPKIEEELTKSYQHLCAHFPEKKPSVVYSFFISPMGANPAAAFSYGRDTVGFNWFNYLGKEFSLYPPLYEGYNYMIEWNQKEYLNRNIMLVEYNLLSEKYKSKEDYSELIYHMIEKGKEFYYLDKICPDMGHHIKIGYTPAQYKWCEENEFEIWAYFKENKVLYSIETIDIKRMTEEGPTTPGMPAESPGMVGAWAGWQIVKSYQVKEKKSLKELMQTSPKEILKMANYKPTK